MFSVVCLCHILEGFDNRDGAGAPPKSPESNTSSIEVLPDIEADSMLTEVVELNRAD